MKTVQSSAFLHCTKLQQSDTLSEQYAPLHIDTPHRGSYLIGQGNPGYKTCRRLVILLYKPFLTVALAGDQCAGWVRSSSYSPGIFRFLSSAAKESRVLTLAADREKIAGCHCAIAQCMPKNGPLLLLKFQKERKKDIKK